MTPLEAGAPSPQSTVQARLSLAPGSPTAADRPRLVPAATLAPSAGLVMSTVGGALAMTRSTESETGGLTPSSAVRVSRDGAVVGAG